MNGSVQMLRMCSGWVTVLIVMAVTACNQNMKPLPDSGSTAAPAAQNAGESARPNVSDSSPQGGGGAVSGTISIAPALTAHVNGSEIIFIIARRSGGGPPLAVKKIDQPRFPVSYTLSSADAMLNEPFAGEIMVVARLDKDGNAGPVQPGDMEGVVSHAHVGDTGVNIVIDRAH